MFVSVGRVTRLLSISLALSAGLAAAQETNASSASESAERQRLQVVISLNEQKLNVYDGERLVTSSSISSGRMGHRTPAGIYSILEKKRFHRSNQYDDAPMPFMQRLTWTGIALHGSDSVPNQAASHGCIRLPQGFDKELFAMTTIGDHVIVNSGMIAPRKISHENLPEIAAREEERRPVRILIQRMSERVKVEHMQKLLNELGYDTGEPDGLMGPRTRSAIAAFKEDHAKPELASGGGAASDDFLMDLYKAAGREGPANAVLQVRRNFTPLWESPIFIEEEQLPLGTHLLLASADGKWLGYTLENRLGPKTRALHALDSEASEEVDINSTLDRIHLPEDVAAKLRQIVAPGASITIADNGVERFTGWKTDFVVTTQIERSYAALPAPKKRHKTVVAKRKKPAKRRVIVAEQQPQPQPQPWPPRRRHVFGLPGFWLY